MSYSTHPLVNKLLSRYMARGFYHDPYIGQDRHLSDLLDPENSNCMCEDVSRDFLSFASQQKDLEKGGLQCDIWKDQNPILFGFNKKLWLYHTVVRVYPDPVSPLLFYTVDFTASQYGVKALPHLCIFDHSEQRATA